MNDAARRVKSGVGNGIRVSTAIFGEVEINEVYASEAEARAAGFVFDAAAYEVNAFGGREAPKYKVLARWTDFVQKEYCMVTNVGDPSARPANEERAGSG